VLEAAFAAAFGLIIGSFLNVCIYRMPRDLSVLRPSRSFCPGCESTIAWYDNIPVISYLLLGRRCRHCQAAIPFRYVLVELATGFLFFAVVLWLGPTLEALKFCVFAAIQVALVAMDLEERILADEFTLGGIAVALIFAAFVPLPAPFFQFLLPEQLSKPWVSMVDAALSAGFLGFILWSIGALYLKLRGREGLGLGDVKMVAMIGSFLGLGPGLLTVVTGSVLGSICGLLYIFFSKKDASTYELPFGSFLGIGALLIAAWARQGSIP
jgi:leader peptidase (prepilin peptidase)/N-methyltransferase